MHAALGQWGGHCCLAEPHGRRLISSLIERMVRGPDANTISLFREGERISRRLALAFGCEAQAATHSRNLKGEASFSNGQELRDRV